MKKIAIIGNGIAGITAARHIRKRSSEHEITVVSGETDHFFSRTALMYIYMGHMGYKEIKPYEDWFWEKNRINLKRAWVDKIDFKTKSLAFKEGGNMDYDTLILATGSKSNFFSWPGQELEGVQGLYSYQDLESMEQYTKGINRAVVVGGGLIGIEMVEMLQSRNIPVTMLVRERSYWNIVLPAEESEMIGEHMAKDHHTDLRLNTELQEIKGTNDRVSSVITTTGKEIPCEFVGITVGVRPNIDFLTDSGLELDKGILVNEYLETNLPDVYAVGDCAQRRQALPGRRPIEQVWYTGRMMGETLARTICGQKTAYQPGQWFNSAKFMDVEWQTYGYVPNELPEDQETLYWQHSKQRIGVRINYNKANGAVSGFNLLGVRYRHEVCDKWLNSGTHIEIVLQNLGAANFDPEFCKEYEQELVGLYNKQTGSELKLKKRRGLFVNMLKSVTQ